MKIQDSKKGSGRFSFKSILGKRYVSAILICLAGVAVNLILGDIATQLKLPLYLDTIGTIVVAAMGGYLPGVVVGFLTNLVRTLIESTSMYYGMLNMLVAFLTALFARKGWFKKVWGVILTILVFTVLGGFVAAVIPWFMEGISFEEGSLGAYLYGTEFCAPE